LKGEIIDGTFMSKKALLLFFKEQVKDARVKNLLFSLHMKATMMKVSDPIIFGHAVRVYFQQVFAKHGETLDKLGVNVNSGLGDLVQALPNLDSELRTEVEADLRETLKQGP